MKKIWVSLLIACAVFGGAANVQAVSHRAGLRFSWSLISGGCLLAQAIQRVSQSADRRAAGPTTGTV